MTPYGVNTVRDLTDADKLARYAELATPAIVAHGGRFIARGLPEAAFEEGALDRTAIIEYPTVEAAVAAYESEAYLAAFVALDGGAVRDIRIIPAA